MWGTPAPEIPQDCLLSVQVARKKLKQSYGGRTKGHSNTDTFSPIKKFWVVESKNESMDMW